MTRLARATVAIGAAPIASLADEWVALGIRRRTYVEADEAIDRAGHAAQVQKAEGALLRTRRCITLQVGREQTWPPSGRSLPHAALPAVRAPNATRRCRYAGAGDEPPMVVEPNVVVPTFDDPAVPWPPFRIRPASIEAPLRPGCPRSRHDGGVAFATATGD
jgi:hypothetical protein